MQQVTDYATTATTTVKTDQLVNMVCIKAAETANVVGVNPDQPIDVAGIIGRAMLCIVVLVALCWVVDKVLFRCLRQFISWWLDRSEFKW